MNQNVVRAALHRICRHANVVMFVKIVDRVQLVEQLATLTTVKGQMQINVHAHHK